MPNYARVNWVDGPLGGTPLDAAHLNVMDQGIADGDVRNPASAAAGLLATQYAPISLGGAYGSRPAAAAANKGALYYATDVPETYRSDGTTWSVVGSGGNELGYAQSLVDTSTTSTTGVDVPGLSVTCTVGERPVKVIFQGGLRNDTLGDYARAYIVVDGAQAAIAGGRVAVAGEFMASHAEARVSGLTPGSSHTFKIQIVAPIGGTTDLYGLTGDPAFIQVVTL